MNPMERRRGESFVPQISHVTWVMYWVINRVLYRVMYEVLYEVLLKDIGQGNVCKFHGKGSLFFIKYVTDRPGYEARIVVKKNEEYLVGYS